MNLEELLSDPYALNRLREKEPGLQDLLGPLEHRQFVEEVTRRSPLVGTGVMAMAPAYSAGKALGLFPRARSVASWDEIFAAWDGYRRGMSPAGPR
jgi:hypothetical protein